jgi:hypothetical protein
MKKILTSQNMNQAVQALNHIDLLLLINYINQTSHGKAILNLYKLIPNLIFLALVIFYFSKKYSFHFKITKNDNDN